MKPAAHLSAAIEVVAEIDARHRPAAEALKDWGASHRFAGSGDRARIASLVYDALRRRASAAHVMGEATPRAILLGTLALARGLDVAAIAALADGAQHAPEPLSEAERAALAAPSLAGAPPHVGGDYPEWLDPLLAEAFGEERAQEGAALAGRAPLDIRVNTLKTQVEKVARQLDHLKPQETPWSPWGLRIPLGDDGRGPPVQAEPGFQRGMFEVQDEGSQVAALLAGAAPGAQVLDLCAGAGGKTLALAAAMDNRGQIYAHDNDPRRLAPIVERLTRANVRNAQVRSPKRDRDVLADLEGRMDLVLVDAPCTGSGTWRRNPDAKWRLKPGSLEVRRAEQDAVLDRAAPLVKAGGRIAYVTCSVLEEENGRRVAAFLERHPGFAPLEPREVLVGAGPRLAPLAERAKLGPHGLLMTPRRTGTDGFFVALLVKSGG